jgi:hypothetical protein
MATIATHSDMPVLGQRFPIDLREVNEMPRFVLFAAVLLLFGCAAIPVQETTLRNANGGSVTCKQVGRGVVSYGVGKSIYEDCIAKAHAAGYQ